MIRKLDKTKSAQYFNFIIKTALIVSFAIAIFFPPEVLVGKGMGARAPIFLASAVFVPLIFWKKHNLKIGETKGYPHIADGPFGYTILIGHTG